MSKKEKCVPAGYAVYTYTGYVDFTIALLDTKFGSKFNLIWLFAQTVERKLVSLASVC